MSGVLSNSLFLISDHGEEVHEIQVKGKGSFVCYILGVAPCPRFRHSCCMYDDCLYVCGGVDSSKSLLNDVWCFSFITCTWTEVRMEITVLLYR